MESSRMNGPTPARILLCSEPPTVERIQGSLARGGYRVDAVAPANLETVHVLDFDGVIVDQGQTGLAIEPLCRQLRNRLADAFVPILHLAAANASRSRLEGLAAGADASLTPPWTEEELLAQVQALVRLKQAHTRLSERTAEFHRVNKQLEQAYQQIDNELQLARKIQHSLLPQSFPEMPPLRFAVHYQPCGRVGGDFYDVFRLDEHHVGFYVADVMGHGIPASLLTIFLKKALRAKEIHGREYRLLPPGEVLTNLNRDMIEQALADSPFITMIYALCDRRSGTLSFSRAGHPHPLYLPRSGPPEFWRSTGTLLGVFETHFSIHTHRLLPGDKLLLFTDGAESESADWSSTGRLPTFADKWRAEPIADFVAALAEELGKDRSATDDITLLGLEMGEGLRAAPVL